MTQVRLVIDQDGKLQVFVPRGTLAQGKAAINTLLASLKAQGIDVDDVSPIEQHRAEDQAHDLMHRLGATHGH